ncbi:MAG: hypothetical protein Q8J97_10825 [Flavobacteriaceae bacterium]|nr:hypothetical protein [Flavobacteriaceae bacterium]
MLTTLREELRLLREELEVKDKTIAALTRKVVSSGNAFVATNESPNRDTSASACEESHVISTVEELDDALSRSSAPFVRIIINASTPLTLLCRHTIASHRVVEMIGHPVVEAAHANNTLQPRVHVIGGLSVERGGRLFATGIEFTASSIDAPCVSVSGKESFVSLTNCALRGGRDGVFVSGGAACHMSSCDIADNIRGVFESFKCRVRGTRCRFTRNHYHCVLLGTRHQQDLLALDHQFPECEFGQLGSKGDVVFDYNPVADLYSKVYQGGVCVVLTESSSTEGLAQSTF